jgi:thymidylate synthase
MEDNYLNLLRDIHRNGTDKTDRTGVGTRSIFGAQLRFNLAEGFPLLTTKKIFTKGVFGELAWLVRGETNIKYLNDNGIHIWDEWADKNGDLGPVYGAQWRHWRGENGGYVDQLKGVINQIKAQPDSRRLLVTAWDPWLVNQMALPPCHLLYQFEVHSGKLSCHMYQRSADVFLGVPFNIASYAALTHLIAHLTNLDVGDLIISFGDVHIYNNHFDQVREQLTREPMPFPRLMINPDVTDIDKVELTDFIVTDYHCHPPIKAEVAV